MAAPCAGGPNVDVLAPDAGWPKADVVVEGVPNAEVPAAGWPNADVPAGFPNADPPPPNADDGCPNDGWPNAEVVAFEPNAEVVGLPGPPPPPPKAPKPDGFPNAEALAGAPNAEVDAPPNADEGTAGVNPVGVPPDCCASWFLMACCCMAWILARALVYWALAAENFCSSYLICGGRWLVGKWTVWKGEQDVHSLVWHLNALPVRT